MSIVLGDLNIVFIISLLDLNHIENLESPSCGSFRYQHQGPLQPYLRGGVSSRISDEAPYPYACPMLRIPRAGFSPHGSPGSLASLCPARAPNQVSFWCISLLCFDLIFFFLVCVWGDILCKLSSLLRDNQCLKSCFFKTRIYYSVGGSLSSS